MTVCAGYSTPYHAIGVRYVSSTQRFHKQYRAVLTPEIAERNKGDIPHGQGHVHERLGGMIRKIRGIPQRENYRQQEWDTHDIHAQKAA